MERLPDEELDVLLNAAESDTTEHKQSFNNSAPRICHQAVCTFASDLSNPQAPGVLLIGVNDCSLHRMSQQPEHCSEAWRR